MNVEFTDRYGDRYPSFLRGCRGRCEAMGYVPIKSSDTREPWATLWKAAEREAPTDDGYHFVECPKCHGTGRVSAIRSILRIPLWLWRASRKTIQFTANSDYFCDEERGFWSRLAYSLRVCFWLDIIRLRN